MENPQACHGKYLSARCVCVCMCLIECKENICDGCSAHGVIGSIVSVFLEVVTYKRVLS